MVSSQHVTKVIKISDSNPIFKLSFSKTPPTVLSICPGHSARMQPVYPLPLRYFKSQQYGHSRTTCRSKHACGRCGSTASDIHDPRTCAREELCFHFIQASSSACPGYQEEKSILIMHHKHNVPLPIARQLLATEREHQTRQTTPPSQSVCPDSQMTTSEETQSITPTLPFHSSTTSAIAVFQSPAAAAAASRLPLHLLLILMMVFLQFLQLQPSRFTSSSTAATFTCCKPSITPHSPKIPETPPGNFPCPYGCIL